MSDRYGKEILYCEVCGEPLEKMIPGGLVLGMDRFPVRCLCQRTKYEKEECERKAREYAEIVSRDHDDGTVSLMKLARKYVDSFPEMIHKSAGLLLWGDVGTGKTYMAACIANALIEQEYTVKMTNFATIINDLFASEDKNEYIECLMRCSLLIIDDLGAERSTEYAVENVFNVIDRRYRTGKPLIITTNLHIDTMRNETSIDKKRIYDRVFEMCAPVQMKGVSKRKASADSKIKLLRELNNRED